MATSVKEENESSPHTPVRLPDMLDRLSRDTEPCPPGPELSSCARCGLPFGREPNHCGDYTGASLGSAAHQNDNRLAARISCRDREIGSVRALLRGATKKLERVMESLDDLLETIS